MTKKLALETKMRDAAAKLSRVNSVHKTANPSSRVDERLETATKRVEAVQREVWHLSEQANNVGRRLLEHRAAVLSISIRNMEKKLSPSVSEDSGYESSNRSTLMSPATAVSTLSTLSAKQAKFDGAHLFAGHENAVVPRKRLSPEAAAKEITTLEQRLKTANLSLSESSKTQADMQKELSLLKAEKQEVETMLKMQLETAEDHIAKLEQDLPRMEELEQEVQALKGGQQRLEESEREVARLRVRVQELEGLAESTGGSEKMLADLRASHQQEMALKDAELQRLRDEFAKERAKWDNERNALEDEKMDDLAQLTEEMDRLRAQDEQVLQQANNELNTTLSSLRTITQRYDIAVGERDPQTSPMQHLLGTITKHMDILHDRLGALEKLANEGKAEQLALAKELAEVKRDRDSRRRDTVSSSARSAASSPARSESLKLPPMPTVTPETTEYGPTVEGAKFIAALQPLWSILPSPEARAAKFGSNNARSYRGSPSAGNIALPSPNGSANMATPGQTPTSLSELDVRSLKALYDPRRQPNTPLPGNGDFTLEGFIHRVNALIADDRALIERLIRFAQAHDLLKKNAERAQKLAQDGNVALETYQKQVKLLESRNSTLTTKVMEL